MTPALTARRSGPARRRRATARPALTVVAVLAAGVLAGCSQTLDLAASSSTPTDGDERATVLVTSAPATGTPTATRTRATATRTTKAATTPVRTSSPARTTHRRSTTSTTKRSSTTTTSTKAAAPSKNARLEASVLSLVNKERKSAGCKALTRDARLAKAARAHSKDMAVHDYFSHDSRDGSSPFDRITATGYRYSTAAENIAAGQRTAAAVMSSWMNSSGHRANILNCALTELGVGVWIDSSSTYDVYWTQDFGTPR